MWFSGMSFEDSVASSPWPYTLPPGWSMEWDPSRPAMTLRNDAMLWAKYGACFATSSCVVVSFPLPSLNNVRQNLKFSNKVCINLF
jgi:hypothetical protein